MEEKMRIIVSGMEPKAPYKHDVKKMNKFSVHWRITSTMNTGIGKCSLLRPLQGRGKPH